MQSTLRSHQNSVTGNVLEGSHRAAAEFLAWAEHHAHEQRLSDSGQAQIEHHPDLLDFRSALAQQCIYARRHAHQKHLHNSAMAHLRHE